ncbi:MAG: phosphatidate cytidylyltransferase [Dehalococcoidales bacterium]|nr:phosphatidate cytidylyltransferase [Dehalococcoidales bacterium]
MLKQKVITALWTMPLLVAAVWFEKPLSWFTLLAAIWGILAVTEFYRLVANAKTPPLTYFGLAWTFLFIVGRDEPYFDPGLLIPLLLTTAVILPLIWCLLRKPKENAFAAWVWTLAGIIYIGWLLGHLVAIRDLEDGRNWALFALFITFASDSAAFFVGRALGRHKLAFYISPRKTWEGAIGGIVGAIIVSLFFLLPTPLILPFSWWQAVILGLLVSIFGQLGDLTESLFKRNMGVKDSGRLLPGHGGFLDRMDSILFAGVVVYYCAIWIA